MARLSALGFMLLLAFAACAQPAGADPAIEKRASHLFSELRCLVCQNQTIAESNAPLAVDLREQVREKVKQGQSDEEIVDYLVARYGDFVRYRPPLKITTVLLWFGPFLLMIVVVVLLLRRLRAKSSPGPAALSDAERSRVAALLADRDEVR